ncbi:hypothetical protein JNUCC1_01494 [Lentibacillus sp. JNUCC-1]|uniref:DUF3231 family protein n=1 Tax=Lentibacillus sp. JNUCC-1 TaxID=2654513 RepID=UPI0012E75BBE|nr:DUF3231 family protein [Lentibacillus sp. JNUCC-1]MUV37688.1 hypothetical protein [Lentibacillus sp. JNUCC-1]
MNSNKPELTSSEIAALWSQYQSDSMSVQIISYALHHAEDEYIRSVLEFALSLSQEHVQLTENLFGAEQIAIPEGFSAQDVNLNAPRLYTDNFFLLYIQNLAKLGLAAYTMAMSNAARLDIVQHFKQCLGTSAELLERATQIKLDKGIFARAPFIPKPKMADYVKEQDYLSGGWFSDKRPLNAIEISNLYFNIERNEVGKALIMGFSQVAQSQEVRKYMAKGRDISEKHVGIFSKIMKNDYLPVPSTWDGQPTDATESPFSDKLMMFHITTMNASGIGQYGAAIGASQRADLVTAYTRLTAEIAKYAKEGADLMIQNNWLEKPPQAADREQIAKNKE